MVVVAAESIGGQLKADLRRRRTVNAASKESIDLRRRLYSVDLHTFTIYQEEFHFPIFSVAFDEAG